MFGLAEGSERPTAVDGGETVGRGETVTPALMGEELRSLHAQLGGIEQRLGELADRLPAAASPSSER
jgi:hypothetical protein